MEHILRYSSLFPGYSFINHIGKGSYGDVYFCIRKVDGSKVALKIVFVKSFR